MTDQETPVTPATRAIAATPVHHRVVRTPRAGSAEESAELQGIPLGALLRTIVVRRGDDDYLFVLVPAGRRFDWPRLREHLGVRRLTLPDAEEARAATGYERYTITPFGSTRAWPAIVDAAVVDEPIVSVGGGAFGVNLHLAPADLVAALDAAVVDVSSALTDVPSADTDVSSALSSADPDVSSAVPSADPDVSGAVTDASTPEGSSGAP
jgi:Cys-tRNA(Pro) deacylase